jgi:hypothetical protein
MKYTDRDIDTTLQTLLKNLPADHQSIDEDLTYLEGWLEARQGMEDRAEIAYENLLAWVRSETT